MRLARPLAMCCECVAKVHWATGADPIERYRSLAEYCDERGLQEDAQFFSKSVEALRE